MADEQTPDGAKVVVVAEISDQRQRELKEIAGRIKDRQSEYARLHRYYDGKHGVRLTPRARRYLMASGLQYAHNFTDVVVDSLVQRLQVTGVTIRIDHVDDEDAGLLAKIWRRFARTSKDEREAKQKGDALTRWTRKALEANCFDQLQNIAHDAAVKLGDAYATGWWDDEAMTPRITVNRPEPVRACYSPHDCIRPESVAKLWDEYDADGKPIQRLNVYYPDRIEKYERPSGNGDWSPHREQSGDVWPVSWTGGDGRPLGLAMVHLRNKNRGDTYGTSELRKAIPQQDALNKRMVDLDLVSDTQGYPQRYAIGVAASSVLKSHPGVFLRVEDPKPETKFGQFDAADLGPLVGAIDMSVKHFAGTTQTPYHLLNLAGAMPSGEALKSAEAPLVKKAEDRMQTFTDCWRDLIRLLIRLAVDQGVLALAPEEESAIEIDIAWASPQSRDARGEWEVVALKQAAGVSQSTTLLEMDYDPDREEQLRATEQTSLGATMLGQFENATGAGGAIDDLEAAA